MKKALVFILILAMTICCFVACDFEECNENMSNNEDKLQEDFINIIEKIAASRPTLDEFKQMYPHSRTVKESIDGSYSYIVISTPDIPDVLFSFERYFGENGFSKIYLTSINASAALLLPEYVNMSIEDILKNEGEHAWYDKIEHESISYGDVYIYRDNFCYYIQGYVHPYKLGTDGIHIKLYDDSFFSPIEESTQKIDKNKISLSEMLTSLASGRCTLEKFKTTFDDWYIVDEKENSLVISSDSLPGIQLEFITIVDNLKNQKTVLSYITSSAELMMPEYIGMDRYEMREAGLEMPRNNEFDYKILFLYEENYCLCTNPNTEYLENNSTVYVVPYTDSWIRPW